MCVTFTTALGAHERLSLSLSVSITHMVKQMPRVSSVFCSWSLRLIWLKCYTVCHVCVSPWQPQTCGFVVVWGFEVIMATLLILFASNRSVHTSLAWEISQYTWFVLFDVFCDFSFLYLWLNHQYCVEDIWHIKATRQADTDWIWHVPERQLHIFIVSI